MFRQILIYIESNFTGLMIDNANQLHSTQLEITDFTLSVCRPIRDSILNDVTSSPPMRAPVLAGAEQGLFSLDRSKSTRLANQAEAETSGRTSR